MFKNKSTKTPIESNKRFKADLCNENQMSNSQKESAEIDDSLNSNSITVYEDDSLTAEGTLNKSLLNRNKAISGILNSSNSSVKRSPLATVSQNQLVSTHKILSEVSKTTDVTVSTGSAETFNNHSSFDVLSDEIILNIFKFLPKKTLFRIALVCKRFNQISQDEVLWVRMDLGNKAIRAGAMGRILTRGFVILRLAHSKMSSPIFENDFLTPDFQSKLQFLDLSLAGIDKPALQQLLNTCRNLKKLSLENVPVDYSICKEIAANKQLEALNLAMCSGIDLNSVTILANNLKELLSLNVAWTSLTTEAITVLMSNLTPKLSRLNISGCRKTLMDWHILILTQKCCDLVEVDVSDCTAISATSVDSLAKLEKLEYLSFSRCYNINTTAYLTLSNMKSLAFLDLFGLLSEQGLEMIKSNLKNVGINKFIHSSVARPTVTPRRTSIWGIRTRD